MKLQIQIGILLTAAFYGRAGSVFKDKMNTGFPLISCKTVIKQTAYLTYTTLLPFFLQRGGIFENCF